MTSVVINGHTYSDDSDPSTGLGNGGHRTRFVPALADVVVVAGQAATSATNAATSATNAATSATNAATSATTAINAPGTNATSTTSLSISVASKTLTIQTGKSIVVGMSVKIASNASPTNWMAGDVTAYNSGTGSLTVNVVLINGSGTFADWVVSLTGVVPATVATTGSNTFTGVQNEFHGADIASAATINLNTATGNLVDVTGSTTITAITLSDGFERTVRFTGTLTLANNASIILPCPTSITTAAGDFAIFRGYAGGVVRCVAYTRASGDSLIDRSGSPIASAATVNLTTATGNIVDVSGTTTITAITLSDGLQRTVRFTGALTLTNGANLVLPGGVNITTAAGDYAVFAGYASSVVRCVSYMRASGEQLLGVRGADITSAASINLTTATGNIVDVTGTTGISAITLSDGMERTVRFTGALTLTNGASLVLPGGANITTAAGDFAIFRGYAAGVVRCVAYTRASGLPIINPTVAFPAGIKRFTVITSSTTYTPLSTSNALYVEVQGAGQGGQSGSGSIPAGGNGGGFASKTFLPTLAASYTVTIGAGGTVGFNSGGTTSFGTVSATGGSSSGAGTGSGGDFNATGCPGDGQQGSNHSDVCHGGGGYNGRGAGRSYLSTTSADAGQYGGGGGSSQSGTGASGGNGVVLVWEF